MDIEQQQASTEFNEQARTLSNIHQRIYTETPTFREKAAVVSRPFTSNIQTHS